MYKDLTSDSIYPKSLIIRNHDGGMIWQIYKVERKEEADILSENAGNNGFQNISLENFNSELEETWPDWRETKGGKRIIQDALNKIKEL